MHVSGREPQTIAKPEFPRELFERVCEFIAPAEFLRAWVATCSHFSFAWYTGAVFTRTIVVPDDAGRINAAINKLADTGLPGRGLVLVRPGTYAESVRVTQNCHILGLGPRDKVIIEAPGWESALVSAGLGSRQVPSVLGWSVLTSGEDAFVENLTFRCRNMNMKGRVVYIVMGALNLIRCRIEGGMLVSGSCTTPRLTDCVIGNSRGNGVHLTDHCKAALHGNRITQHGRHGILICRHSSPEVIQNTISSNGVCGIRMFRGSSKVPLASIRDNVLEDNGCNEISLMPGCTEAEFGDSDGDEVL